MTAFTIQDVSRRSGLSEPTLRYYEQVGLVGPVDRDEHSGHRRYRDEDLNAVEVLACLRAVGVGIEAEIVAQQARLGYLRAKAAVWDARDRGDAAAEAKAWPEVRAAAGALGVQ